ncbi:hypothetical protein JD508_20050 [Aeromonas jandaei]|uniref:hypothetical protein n=1 Tax=Aeromonas TaxID=642 RepID=UPI00191F2FEF|nr:hypothetical protein [Aeromonas jandaei]MBL0612510.1 hypothetical protein [Aeromonas jandaei]
MTHIHIGGDATGFQFMQNSPKGQQQQTVSCEQKAVARDALQLEPDTLKVQGAPQAEMAGDRSGAGSLLAVLEGAGGWGGGDRFGTEVAGRLEWQLNDIRGAAQRYRGVCWVNGQTHG